MTRKALSTLALVAALAASLPLTAEARHHKHRVAAPAATSTADDRAAYDRQACEDRQASHAKTGTIVGAAAGGVAGGLIGKGKTVNTLLGAGVGAGVGALAGHQVGKMTVKC